VSYAKALERLESWPSKRLIVDRYALRGECCAIGVAVPETREMGDANACSDPTVDDLVAFDDGEWRLSFGADCGMTLGEAASLQRVNDEPGDGGETPEQRYARVLAWLRAKAAAARDGGR
jgi:hypothetical protein